MNEINNDLTSNIFSSSQLHDQRSQTWKKKKQKKEEKEQTPVTASGEHDATKRDGLYEEWITCVGTRQLFNKNNM